VVRLARKELTEILRDRRTILTLILMPVLLYPLLAIGFRQVLAAQQTSEKGPTYRLGFPSEDEALSIRGYLIEGEKLLLETGLYSRSGSSSEGPEKPRSSFPQPIPTLEYLETQDLEGSVLRGEVDIGLRNQPPGRFRPYVDRELAVDCKIYYRSDSALAAEAARYVIQVCNAANLRFLALRLDQARVHQQPMPVKMVPQVVEAPSTRRSSLLTVVPLVLILMTITGAVYPAIDLTAGERERGTLEILVAAPIPRLSLLFAKYIAVVTVAMLTALVNLGMMAITLLFTQLGADLFGPSGFSPLVLMEVFGLMLLFAAFFSAVLLVITSFARSFKEAQAYLIPLMLVALLPGMLSLLPLLPLQGVLLFVPLLNIVLLARDLLNGTAELGPAIIVVLATLTYALGAIAVAARIFGAEAVLYSQPSGWFSGWRRPDPPKASQNNPA
jgi:ABC-2 type transport system permease protein/sodium transport system permease protein